MAREAPNTLQSDTTFKRVLGIGQGPIRGLIDGKKSLYIDGQQAQSADGTDNFKGLTYEIRTGTDDQTAVKGFTSSENYRNVGIEVFQNTSVTQSINNSDATSARVVVELPRLSYTNTDNGKTTGTYVDIAIDVTVDGTTTETLRDRISGKTNSSYRRAYEVDLPQGTNRSVRLRRLTADAETNNYQNQSYFAGLAEIVDAPFTYPGTALIYVRGSAKQLGGKNPEVIPWIEGMLLEVPSNYDPFTRTYTGQWDGLFKVEWTNNPAWVLYNVITNDRWGAGIENVDVWSLYDDAVYCDELVDDGFGGQEPRFTFNARIDGHENVFKAINTIAGSFRAVVYYSNDAVVVSMDRPRTDYRIISNANVVNGEFIYNTNSFSERTNIVELTFLDSRKNFEPSDMVVEAPEFRRSTGMQKRTKSELVGVTSRGQALRAGRNILYSEHDEYQNVSFRVGLENLDLRPNDLIKVSDFRLHRQHRQGRLKPSSTLDTLVLDQEPNFTIDDTWSISVRMPSGGNATVPIHSVNGAVVNLAHPLPEQPVPQAVFLLNEPTDKTPLYSVLSISEGENNIYEVTAKRHNPSKYDYIDSGSDLEFENPIVERPDTVPAPTNVNIETFPYLAGSREHQGLTISWTPPDSGYVVAYELQIRTPEDTIFSDTIRTEQVTHELRDIVPGTYGVRVRSIDSLGRESDWEAVQQTVSNLLLPVIPDTVNFQTANTEIKLTPISSRQDQEYEFYRSPTSLAYSDILNSAALVGKGNTITDTKLIANTTYYYYIRAYNNYGFTDFYPIAITTDNDVDEVLHQIPGAITENELYPVLNSRIDLVDGPETLPGSVKALLKTESDARTSADSAIASDLSALQVVVDGNSADIISEQTARANADSALANDISTLQVELDDNYAALQTKAEVSAVNDIANDVVDIKAEWTVKTDVNGHIAGIGLMNDGATSTFGILADQFFIADPNTGATSQLVLLDQNGLYLNTDTYIKATSIKDAQIESLEAEKLTSQNGTFAEVMIGNGEVLNEMLAPQIRHNNYVPGVSGWQIDKNGSVDFNEGSFRGIVEIQSGSSLDPSTAVGSTTVGDIDTTANTALSNAAAAQADHDAWVRPGSTLIDGNKIFTGDAYVDTLQIQGQAVTFPRGTTSSNTGYWGGGSTVWHSALSLYITSTGAPMIFNVTYEGAVTNAFNDTILELRVVRDGVVVFGPVTVLRAYVSGSDEAGPTYGCSGIASLSFYLASTTTGTYTLQVKGRGNYTHYYYRAISALEAKR